MLTVLLPTKDRPADCASQLRFLRDIRLPYPILVTDSSAPDAALQVRTAAEGIAKYSHFPASLRMADKLLRAISEVSTPFTVICPDDDIMLATSIDRALAFLSANKDYVAAHGYILDLALHGTYVDIHGVSGFTPSIDENTPLRRHYHLMRRYQPFYWGVFRTDVLRTSLSWAVRLDTIMFRELTVMNTAILQGKVARLPVIYQFRSASTSLTPLRESHPLYWFLSSPQSLLTAYRAYRDNLASFIKGASIRTDHIKSIDDLIDVIHGLFLQKEINPGVLNYAIQRTLGDPLPPVPEPVAWTGWKDPGRGDQLRPSKQNRRQYVWRANVLCAEPRDEISIDNAEIETAERQLDCFFAIPLISDERESSRGDKQGDAQRLAERNPQNFVTSE
jgi:glycosyltransferase domain-containing protein